MGGLTAAPPFRVVSANACPTVTRVARRPRPPFYLGLGRSWGVPVELCAASFVPRDRTPCPHLVTPHSSAECGGDRAGGLELPYGERLGNEVSAVFVTPPCRPHGEEPALVTARAGVGVATPGPQRFGRRLRGLLEVETRRVVWLAVRPRRVLTGDRPVADA